MRIFRIIASERKIEAVDPAPIFDLRPSHFIIKFFWETRNAKKRFQLEIVEVEEAKVLRDTLNIWIESKEKDSGKV